MIKKTKKQKNKKTKKQKNKKKQIKTSPPPLLFLFIRQQ
jgi:hypothetical protein